MGAVPYILSQILNIYGEIGQKGAIYGNCYGLGGHFGVHYGHKTDHGHLILVKSFKKHALNLYKYPILDLGREVIYILS